MFWSLPRDCCLLVVALCYWSTVGASRNPEDVDPCKRQLFTSKCKDPRNPSGAGYASQFVLRYYRQHDQCVTYPFGRCENDPVEKILFRYHSDCVAHCLSGSSSLVVSSKNGIAVVVGANGPGYEIPFNAAPGSTTPTASTNVIINRAPDNVVPVFRVTPTERNPVTQVAMTNTVEKRPVSKTVKPPISRVAVTVTRKQLPTWSITVTTPIPTSTAMHIRMTECEKQLQSAGIKGEFNPSCKSDGMFESVQCYLSECWCVEPQSGLELQHTRRKDSEPKCAEILLSIESVKSVTLRNLSPQCKIAVDNGPCDLNQKRWYYNLKKMRCESFMYGGCNGNENNFASKQDCEDTCISPPLEICPLNLPPLLQRNGDVYLCGGEQSCPTGSKCVYHHSFALCCSKDVNEPEEAGLLKVGQNTKCDMPKHRGDCKQYELRFYYNRFMGECKYFFYGGCGGNGNNFESMDSCRVACVTAKPDAGAPASPNAPGSQNIATTITKSPMIKPCTQTKDPGPCRGMFTRWYLSIITNKCQSFKYGGCLGNGNNFASRQDCEDQCGALPEDICQHPQVSGPCSQTFIRWYFNPNRGECRTFAYGGCDGNENNFNSRGDCEAKCVGIASPQTPHWTDVTGVPTLRPTAPPKTTMTSKRKPTQPISKPSVAPPSSGQPGGQPTNTCPPVSSCSWPCVYSRDRNGCRACNCPTTEPTQVRTTETTRIPTTSELLTTITNQLPTTTTTTSATTTSATTTSATPTTAATTAAVTRTTTAKMTTPSAITVPTQKDTTMTSSTSRTKTEFDNLLTEPVFPIQRCPPITQRCVFPCDIFTDRNGCQICVCEQSSVVTTQKPQIIPVWTPMINNRPSFNWNTPDTGQQQCPPIRCFNPCEIFTTPEGCQTCGCPAGFNIPGQNPNQPPTTRRPPKQVTGTILIPVANVPVPAPGVCPPVDLCPEPCVVLTLLTGCQRCSCPDGIRLSTFVRPHLATSVVRTVAPQPRTVANNWGTAAPVPPSSPIWTVPPGWSFATRNSTLAHIPDPLPTIPITEPPITENQPARTNREYCNEPIDAGPCEAAMVRYAFSVGSGKCQSFIYGGCAGNRNHFYTHDECRVHCQLDDSSSGIDSRLDGQTTALPRGFFVTKVSRSQHTTTNEFDALRFQFTANQGLKLTPSTTSHPSTVQPGRQPSPTRQPGPSNYQTSLTTLPDTLPPNTAGVPTYRTETQTPAALPTTVVQLPQTTGPTPSPVEVGLQDEACKLPQDPGPCTDYVKRWWYNEVSGECIQFDYGSCGGNHNNFPIKATCEARCVSTADKYRKYLPPNCAIDYDSGYCSAYNVRWYFNKYNLECEQFVWTGCGGNENNFETKNLCESSCPVISKIDKYGVEILFTAQPPPPSYGASQQPVVTAVPPQPTAAPVPSWIQTYHPPAVPYVPYIPNNVIHRTTPPQNIVYPPYIPNPSPASVPHTPIPTVPVQPPIYSPAPTVPPYQPGVQQIGGTAYGQSLYGQHSSTVPVCLSGKPALTQADGRVIQCLPGKGHCPPGANCHFNGLDFYCCPMGPDPYGRR